MDITKPLDEKVTQYSRKILFCNGEPAILKTPTVFILNQGEYLRVIIVTIIQQFPKIKLRSLT